MERSVPARLALLALLLHGTRCGAKEPQCEEITVPLCRGLGYNHTHMPNQLKHESQDEAGLEVHQFWPLVEIRCSADLRFFLCSIYTPICLEDYKKPLPPCRSVCERARAGCAPLMRQYGFPWPERMRCELLPQQGDRDTLCMDYNRSASTTAPPPRAPKPTNRALKPHVPKKKPYGRAPGRHTPGACEPGCYCREPMVPVRTDHPLLRHVRTGQVPLCALPCHSPYLSHEQRAFTSSWLGVWSALCFTCTLVTVATFLIDMERFQYPERPIVFMSACYLCVSLGYLVRLVAGHEAVACARDGGVDTVRYGSAGPALCTLVFLLVYFFGMASSIWWVILSLTWFLAAALKWGNEAIAAHAQYFHLAAWLVPSVQSILVLALSAVDGDSVAGLCSVGNQSLQNLRGFVLAPLVLYLCLGTGFVLVGFVSLFRIRSVIKQGGTKTHALERLMVRIGVFTVLYTVPAAVIVACYFYEQHNRSAWEMTHTCTCGRGAGRARPLYAVFMLKYFMGLLAGISSGAWVCSGKTLDSWRTFCARCCWSRKAASGSAYSDVSTGLTWRSGTASSVSCPKQMPLSRV
ncbi:frizzled-8-like [Eucyclogobius newberryi]|uniref:frizzled-8-like n=1 Tax=Eucyclogobius newberryi TaxID=166745 RepID=UPI003B5C024A